MKTPQPVVPGDLHPLAREILDLLRDQPDAAAITIGGGVALQHYLNRRQTVDLDAWWTGEATPGARQLLQETMSAMAERHAWTMRRRTWGDTESYELVRGSQKVFAFQISRRSVNLDPPLSSHWPPVALETFRDNLGSKMNALVERGAPRDFVDVFHVCTHALVTPGECWDVWAAKNPQASALEARAKILERLSAIEARRPLPAIAGEVERAASARLRDWVKQVLCRGAADGNRPGP